MSHAASDFEAGLSGHLDDKLAGGRPHGATAAGAYTRRGPRFTLRGWAISEWRMGPAEAMAGHGPQQEQDNNSTVTGARSNLAEGHTLADITEPCPARHARRFAGHDDRLPRPTAIPALARATFFFLRAPKRMARLAPRAAA